MKTLAEVVAKPSGFDSLSNYMGEVPEKKWLCLLTQTRDGGCLERSNFRSAFKELGGKESDTVRIDRFGHWACGWWESLSVLEGSKEHKKALKIEEELEGYPVVSDDDFSELEWEEATAVWCSFSIKERVELCQKYKISIFEARHDYIPSDDTGELQQYLNQ
jgi:hypothetical protein